MKKIVKLTETDLKRLVNRVLQEAEHENDRYMFFSNLEQIKRQADMLLEMDKDVLHQILENGHDWAQDHVATAKENMDQIFDFFMNEIKGDGEDSEDYMEMNVDVMEGRKKTGTKLCARGKAAAKAKYDVYPSAYANGYAVQVCKGKQPGLDGKKRCSGAYC
jgi:nitrogen fixation/metabolism regulation signal transduction histidine kinase